MVNQFPLKDIVWHFNRFIFMIPNRVNVVLKFALGLRFKPTEVSYYVNPPFASFYKVLGLVRDFCV